MIKNNDDLIYDDIIYEGENDDIIYDGELGYVMDIPPPLLFDGCGAMTMVMRNGSIIEFIKTSHADRFYKTQICIDRFIEKGDE